MIKIDYILNNGTFNTFRLKYFLTVHSISKENFTVISPVRP